MGFFDRWMNGRFDSKAASLIAELTVDHHSYILDEMDICFSQSMDHKMRPDSPVQGSLVSMTFSDTPHQEIIRWLSNSHIRKTVEIRFYLNRTQLEEGTQMLMIFKDATCVKYRKEIRQGGSRMFTSLAIAPLSVQMGDEIFEASS